MSEVAHESTDVIFGAVTVAVDVAAGRVSVQGERIPTTIVERTAEVPLQAYVPIGTRNPDALRLTVGGAREWLRPSRGRISRRSYRVRARVGSADLLFTPRSPTESRLVRGTSYRGDNGLGGFARLTGGAVVVEWSREVSALGVTAPAAEPSPEEAAVGYAVAAAFGTGARIFLAAVFEGAETSAPLW
jgi:hypothetical protein